MWAWMKRWIQEHHYFAMYDPTKIPFHQLKVIIQSAWDAIPDNYIEGLYDSWYHRCQAVIDAEGGPTKY